MNKSSNTSSESPAPSVGDLAGTGYWESSWRIRNRQRAVDPRALGVRNHLRRCFHAFFCEVLGDGNGRALVEVGCADSVWLPYFNKELRFSIAGIDYSETGCEKARSILRDSSVEGVVYEADMFNPPAEVLGQFDVVFSYGLVEHFSSTADAIRALARLLRPNGLVLTIVPNLMHVNGALQRAFDRKIYDLHVPLGLRALADSHRDAGLVLLSERHLMSMNFGLLVVGSDDEHKFSKLCKRAMQSALIGCQVPLWWLESNGLRLLPENRWTSPYLAVVAQCP